MTETLKTYILDILSILLPGALLILIFFQSACIMTVLSGIEIPKIEVEWIRVLAYVGMAYIVGHFVFFFGSFLDDWIFENVKKVFWNDTRLPAYIIQHKADVTGIKDREVLNAFKWSCAWLLLNNPSMYAVVERHIAESKFFRSLVVVWCVALVVFLGKANVALVFTSLLLLFFSFIRYLTQRQKSIETAYHFIITASEIKFKEVPNELIKQLSNQNIYPCGEKNNKPSIAIKILILNYLCIMIKVMAVFNLCFNPFRLIVKKREVI